ncbi:MAG: hypothetical protein GX021_08035 [Tissierellia bacterium]|nr:hypothetical protein [Tissierellia bacterium]
METRLERNLRIRKEKRIKRAKRLCILLLFIFLYLGLQIVNQNIVELNCLDNPTIFRLDLKTRQIDIFGDTYIIDLDIIKDFLKTSFSGLLVLHCGNYLL